MRNYAASHTNGNQALKRNIYFFLNGRVYLLANNYRNKTLGRKTLKNSNSSHKVINKKLGRFMTTKVYNATFSW